MNAFRLRTLLTLLVAVPALCLSVFAQQVQPAQPSFGPAVQAYLLGLDEEKRELEFQLRQREISRIEYTRATGRLRVLRRNVEQIAKDRSEDIVPELEVLAEDELSALGLIERPDPAKLEAGTTLADRWKLLTIETGRPRFFVFEHLPLSGPELLPAGVDPQEIIETVRVEEPRIQRETANESGADSTNGTPVPVRARLVEPVVPPPPPPLEGPRIVRFYLPTYSKNALEKGIEGELIVSALFRRDKKIKDISIDKSLGHGLDERAREAVRRIEFEPARYEGAVTDVRAPIVFNFSMMRVTVRVGAAERIEEKL